MSEHSSTYPSQLISPKRPGRISVANNNQIFNWPKTERKPEVVIDELANKEHDPVHHSKSHFIYNVLMDFFIVLVIGAEVSLVISVAATHFTKYYVAEEIEAGIVSIFPIFYNFVGVIYFLSSKRERIIIEKIFPKRPYLTDIFQIPVFGPFLTTLSVFVKSWSQNTEYEYYERLEASATKMRQSVTFFSSAPEAMVQMSLMLADANKLTFEKYWLEICTILVAIFAIAEANVYAIVSDYYKLFEKSADKTWKVSHALKFSQKIYLLLHGFFSVATNLLSRTFLTNAAIAYFTGPDKSSTFVILVFFMASTIARQIIFYFATIIKYLIIKETMPSAFYDSFNYGWRTAILNTDFQSDSKVRQIWFYIENGIGYVIWYFVMANTDNIDGVKPNTKQFLIFSCLFAGCFSLSICGLLLTRYFLKLNALQNFLFNSKSLFTQIAKGVTQIGPEKKINPRGSPIESTTSLDSGHGSHYNTVF